MAINKRFTQLNNSGSNHNLLDAYSGKVTGSFEVTGAAYFAGGLSGSLTKLVDGSDYLLAGPYITITTNSLGQIEVSGSAGASVPEYFYSLTNNIVESSGSLYVSGAMRALSLSASNGSEISGSAIFAGAGGAFVGSDTAFFVSGNIDGFIDGSGVAAFGGAVYVSGVMQVSTSFGVDGPSTFGLNPEDYAFFNGHLTASAGIEVSNITSPTAVVVLSPLTASVGLDVNPEGTGRGLFKFGGVDIGPITGSNYVVSADGTGYLSGSILSASNGVFDGTFGATVRHEFHIIAAAPDLNSDINSFAATYLVMSSIASSTGIQKVRSVTELSRETSGSYAANWDVNITEDGIIELTSSIDSGITNIYWYGQRTKEMSINIIGSRS